MAQRRSLTDSISPLAAEFIKQGTAQAAAAATQPSEAAVVELPKLHEVKPMETDNSPLITVSYRLPDALVKKLCRESTERKIKKLKPWTQQEIVAAAITEWLANH
jgi:hypothetical protein